MSSETMTPKSPSDLSGDCYLLYESTPKKSHSTAKRSENGSDHCKRNCYSSYRMACTCHRCTCANLKTEYPSYALDEIRLFQEMQSQLDPDVKFCNLRDGEKADKVKNSSQETGYCTDSLDCEIIWVQNSTSPDTTADQEENRLDIKKDTNADQGKKKKINNDCSDIQPLDLNEKPVVSNSVSVKSQNVDDIVSTLNNNSNEKPYKKQSRKRKDKKKKKDKKRPYKCGVYKKSLSSLKKLKSHVSEHVKKVEFEAEVWKNYVLAFQKLNYENHRTKAEKGFICEFCNQACAGRWALFFHSVFTHPKQRPFHCKYCPYNYKRLDHLRRHTLMEHGKHLK